MDRGAQDGLPPTHGSTPRPRRCAPPNDWSPEVATEIAREKREIETLVPALPAHASGSTVWGVGARELNGAIYVIVVNASRSPASETIVVPALGDRTLLTLDGTGSVGASAGSFADSLAPLEVKLYVSHPVAL